MARLSSQLVISLMDRVTGPARKVGNSLGGITKKIKETNAQRVTFGDRIDAAITRNNRALERARGSLLDAGIAAYALKTALGGPVMAAAEFETQLEDIGQKASIPQERLAALGAQIRKVAQETNQGASEIASAVDSLVGKGASEDVALAAAGPIGKAATAYGAATDDLAAAAYAAVDNLNVPADQIGAAIDGMAQSGKEGSFELQDMAQYFPKLGAAYGRLGQEGTSAVYDLAAALQVVRKGTGDSASAATNLENVLNKIYAPATVAKFKKKGVDIRKAMADAAEQGLNPLEAIAEITNKTLDGDLSRMGELFEDSQVQAGLTSLIQELDEFRRIRKEAGNASGVVDKDFARRIQTAQGAMDRWNQSIENLNISLGTTLVPLLNDILDRIVPFIYKVGELAAAYPDVTKAVVSATAAVIGFRIAAASLRFIGLVGRGGLLDMASFGLRGVTFAGKKATGTIAALGKAALALTFLPLRRSLRSTRRSMDAFRISSAVAGRRGAFRDLALSALSLVNPFRWMKVSLGLGIRGLVGLARAVKHPVAVLGLLALAGAAKFVKDNWAGMKELGAEFKESFISNLEPLPEKLQPLKDKIVSLGEAIRDRIPDLQISTEKWRSWGTSLGEIAANLVNTGADWAVIGAEWIQSLWDGAVERFDAFIEWVKNIPSRVKASIGKIDLGSAIGFGGDEAPAPLSTADTAGLSPDKKAAAEKLMDMRQNGGVPSQSEMDDLIRGAEAIQNSMRRNADTQRQISQQYSAENAAKLNANYQAGYAKMQADLDEINAKIEAQRQRTEEAKAAMIALGATEASPVINTENIDALINKLRTANASMNRLNGGASPASPGGARARGGPISRGTSYLVGERGPELITASRSGYVNTAAQTAGMGGATVNFSPSFSFSNTRSEDAAEIEARIRSAMRREVREAFRGIFADTGSRFA